MNDAELSVGIEDNLTPTLQKMAAQTRAFGSTIGAEAGKIDKAVRQVTKSIADLNGAGTKTPSAKSSPLAARTAQLTAELKAQEAILSRLSRAQGAYASASSFSGFRDANGKGISAQDVRSYQQATQEVQRLQGALAAIPEAERRIQQAQAETAARSSAHNAQQLANIKRVNQETTEYAAKQAMYNSMFAKTSWWPPEMLKGPGKFAETVVGMQNSVRYAMYDVSRSTAIAGAAVLALGVGAVVTAARWERAFADVQRTVQGTPATLEQIRQGLIALSQNIPVSFSNLAEIASVGGQLGISANGIVAYTETIAKLTATTNLTADAASKALGRFKAFFSEADDPTLAVTDQTFSNLASSILRVGVNSVATESGIVNVATQISSMGSYAGFTADQVIGLAGALSSVGVPPELSRGVITRLFNTIGEAVAENGTKLTDFARLAGVSSADFAQAWGTEKFAPIFVNLIDGLDKIAGGGGDAVTALHDLGITSVRDVPVLLRLAEAAGEAGAGSSLLAQTMNDARQGWRQNIELTLQYNKIADTLVERTKVLLQNFEALFATMGEGAVGPVKEIVNGLIDLVKGFTAIASTPAGQWFGIATVGATALAGALLLMASGAARGFAMLQGLAVALTEVTGSAAVAAAAVRGVGIAMIGLGAVGAIAAVVGIIAALAVGAQQANNSITDTRGAVEALKEDADSGAKGLFTLGGAGSAAADGLAKTSTQADILAGITDGVAENLYGVGDAADTMGAKTENASLVFADASTRFVRNALLADKAFTDLFAGDDGQDFGQRLRDAGFEMDTLIKKIAGGGAGAGSKYLEKLLGTTPNTNVWDDISRSWVWMDQTAAKTARSAGDLVNQVAGSVEGMRAAGSAALSAAGGLGEFTSAAQMSDAAMEDFEVQNQDLINSMANGFAKFVDSGTLIGLTQQMNAAFATIDDGTTEVDEHAEAVANFDKAWRDAYGGAAFTIEDYMVTFRRAAGEQQVFISNLQNLLARGVPADIIGDLAAMGPQAQALVQALVESTDAELNEYVDLYGSTGFDAMVAMAAGQLAAQNIVMEAAKHLSNAQLRELSADLAAGTPLTDAMAKWNLDAQGRPMSAPATVYSTDDFMWRFQQTANRNPLHATMYIHAQTVDSGGLDANGVKTSLRGGFAGGGYTGAGGKYDYAGPAHRGEFIFTKAETDQSTRQPKPEALMRYLKGGTPARRGNASRGYADGGYAGGGGTGQVIAHLSVEDRGILMLIADRVGLTFTQDTITNLANAGNTNSSNRRQG